MKVEIETIEMTIDGGFKNCLNLIKNKNHKFLRSLQKQRKFFSLLISIGSLLITSAP